jgi:glycosyltransferase involved in cell wall biosynthesis
MFEIEILEKNIEKRVGGEVIKRAPKVSIITPAYNIAEYIGETLDSVLAQTFKDFEIIIINDGSPDTPDFEHALAPYLEKIVYLKQKNTGAGGARDNAIAYGRGELLAFLDGDDIWKPEFLESQVDFLEKNELDLVYADAMHFGGSAYDGKTYMETAPSEGEANFDSLLDLRCNVITSGTVARKKAVIDAGMFERESVRAHDFVLWLKMAYAGARIGYQRKVLLKYRVRVDSLSGNSFQRVEREIDVFRRVKKKFELNEAQRKIVENQLRRLESDLEVERGKSFLLQENFDSAKDAFSKANKYRRSNRLRVVIGLLQIAPRLLLKFYRARRAEEIAFVPVGKNQK